MREQFEKDPSEALPIRPSRPLERAAELGPTYVVGSALRADMRYDVFI